MAMVDSMPGCRAVVLDMEATNQMDVTSLDVPQILLPCVTARTTSTWSGRCGRFGGAEAVGSDGGKLTGTHDVETEGRQGARPLGKDDDADAGCHEPARLMEPAAFR